MRRFLCRGKKQNPADHKINRFTLYPLLCWRTYLKGNHQHEHVFTHDELVAVEEDTGDDAGDEDENNADEDEGEVDLLL